MEELGEAPTETRVQPRPPLPAEPAEPATLTAPAEPATPRALWPTFMRRTLAEDMLRRESRVAAE